MTKCVLLLEDDADLAELVRDLLESVDYHVVHVTSVPALLQEADKRSPCVALVDATSSTSFDLWWLGPVLSRLGVPPVAFTAHMSARQEFERDRQGYVGVVAKPFDADEFIEVVRQICWEEHASAVS